MNRLSEEQLDGLTRMEEGGDHGLELVKEIDIKDFGQLSVFYDENTDHFTVEAFSVDEVIDRWTGCTGIEALQLVMALVEAALED